MVRRAGIPLVFVLAFVVGGLAQTNRIDTVTPSAPELASYGQYAIGVRTIQATDRNRPDVLNTKEGGPAKGPVACRRQAGTLDSVACSFVDLTRQPRQRRQSQDGPRRRPGIPAGQLPLAFQRIGGRGDQIVERVV